MSILVNQNSKVICQGLGKAGKFHCSKCVEYGTNLVGAVKPGKGNTNFTLESSPKDYPFFNTVEEAVKKADADTSLIFVPSSGAADAIMEAADAGIKTIICITEGIPILDMARVKSFLPKDVTLIGPNCPGVISPGKAKVGIMPGYIHKEGNIGVISRSGTLTYEAVWQLSRLGMGQSTCIGIGGDQIIGSPFIDILEKFKDDPETKGVVIIGEIGGDMEEATAEYIKKSFPKPVVAFIAGQTAPPGKRMGHAGAIIQQGKGTAVHKIEVFKKNDISVALSPAEIGVTMQKALLKN